MQKTFKIAVNVGLAVFFISTAFLVSLYLGMLYDKIVSPQFKNMNTMEAIFFGALSMAFFICDVIIVKRFISLMRKGNR